MAEMYLGFALGVVPKGSAEELGICIACRSYKRALELKSAGLSDQDIADILHGIEFEEVKDAARRK
jgi:hypothetical protein